MKWARKTVRWVVVLLAMSLVAASCGDDDAGDLTPVKVQLQWVAQSQFAGFYAALDQGFYEDEGLDVTILEGAVEIVPQQVLAAGAADFAVAWVPKALVSREEGVDIVNIAQHFQRSATLQVSFADSGIRGVADWAGKNVGNWGFGNELEMIAALEQFGIRDDVTIVPQSFDMSGLINGEVDAAQAMRYNEYAQILETENPETGNLYQPEELFVVSYEDVGTGMLQDAIWVRDDWIQDSANQDLSVKFLKATFKGWIYCRDNFDSCVDIVLKFGTTLGESHQAWQLNEINDLIWPSPNGIGIMDQAKWNQTVDVSKVAEFISGDPDADAFRTDIAQRALDELRDEDEDVVGAGFTKRTVELQPGGE